MNGKNGQHTSGSLLTTMQPVYGAKADPKGDRDDLYDHNQCPVFSKPHDKGPDTIPLTFEEGINGKQYHGPLTGNEAKVSSTMRGGKA